MARPVRLFDVVTADVGIDFGGRDVSVTEQLLDAAEIGAPLDEVSREGVPEHVRVEVPLEAGALGVTSNQLPDRLPRHRLAPWSREEDEAAREARLLGPPREVFAHVLEREGAERYNPSFVPLPERNDHTPVEVEVPELQGDELTGPQSAGISEAQKGPVPKSAQGLRIGGAQHFEQLVGARRAREAASNAGGDQSRGDRRIEAFLLLEIAKEGPERRDAPAERAGTESALALLLDEGPEQVRGDLVAAPDLSGLTMSQKSAQVPTVSELGVLGEPAGKPQVAEESLDIAFEGGGHAR